MTGQPVKANRLLIDDWLARPGIGSGGRYISPVGWAPYEPQPQRPLGRPRLGRRAD